MHATLRILAFALACATLAAPPAPAAERTHDVTLDDYFTLATITELAVSPDGKAVAYTVATWDKADDDRKTDLWVVATDGKGKPTRLTVDRANDRHPKWARRRQGDLRPRQPQARGARRSRPTTARPRSGASPLDGGEPQAGHPGRGRRRPGSTTPRRPTRCSTPSTPTATDEDDFTKLRDEVRQAGVRPRQAEGVARCTGSTCDTWRAEKVIAEKRYVREFAVTQDGKRIAMITALDDTVIKSEGESRVDVWDADAARSTPPTRRLAQDGRVAVRLAGDPGVDPGRHAAAPSAPSSTPTRPRSSSASAKDGKWATRRAMQAAGRRARPRLRLAAAVARRSTALRYLAEQAGEVGVVRLRRRRPAIRSGDAAAGRRGGLRRSTSTPTASRPVAVDRRRRALPGAVRGRTGGEAAAAAPTSTRRPQTWKLPTVQHVTWKAPDGTEVGGVLELPPGYKKGDKLPLVVAIHGGPTTSSQGRPRASTRTTAGSTSPPRATPCCARTTAARPATATSSSPT